MERVPTYKEALDNVRDKDIHTYGFLGYPILQTSDIVMYGEPDGDLIVPVGEDQAPHVELSRAIVGKMNFHFGITIDVAELRKPENTSAVDVLFNTFKGEPGFSQVATYSLDQIDRLASDLRNAALEEGVKNVIQRIGSWLENNSVARRFIQIRTVLAAPEVMLTRTPRIPGTDGRKMSKSYGNFISLSESDESIRAKTKVMVTDPARKRRTDPGNPDVCPVYDWHKLFSPPETLEWSAKGCRSAGIGCIECKMAMADNLIKWIAPVRARREEYAAHPATVLGILDEGATKAREVAQKTMTRVREAVFNWPEKRAEVTGQLSSAKNVKAGD